MFTFLTSCNTNQGKSLKLITLSDIVDLKTLRALCHSNCATSALGYYTLDNFIKWHERDKQLQRVRVYTLNDGRWRHNGLYMIVDCFQLFVHILPVKEAQTLLRTALKMLDWTKGFKITAIPDMYIDTVHKVLEELRLTWEGIRLNIYQLAREKALNIKVSCPSGFKMRSLNIADAKLINELWHANNAGSLEIIKRLIIYNNNIGVYAQESGELVAWCIRCQSGFIGMLHVKPTYRRSGLALLLCLAMVQEIATQGDEVRAMIHEHNEASKELCKKLCFQQTGVTHIIYAYYPTYGAVWIHKPDSKSKL
ncbi:uncharacterized protein LOC105209797 [Zeugodacus cucurbitae]|uniref:uncharacterized protein LOC105209797 n=1 Tax=Zeugodacus cucurbitae TaxID=28588 RepID=UPI0023D8EE5D|nr:uncharacterized protein LOC105209797 [Zeugodacus cucurbitae]